MAKRSKRVPNLEVSLRRRLAKHMASRPKEVVRIYPLPKVKQRGSHKVTPLAEHLKGMSTANAKAMFNDLMGQVGVLHNNLHIVHADIHPGNIILVNGKPHLSNFHEAQDFRGDKTTPASATATSLFMDLSSVLDAFRWKIPEKELESSVERYLGKSKYDSDVKKGIVRLVRQYHLRNFRGE